MRSFEGGGGRWEREVVEGGPGRVEDVEGLREKMVVVLFSLLLFPGREEEWWSREEGKSPSEGARRSQTIHHPRLVLLVRSRSWRTTPEGSVDEARDVAVRVARTWLWTLRASIRVQEDVREEFLFEVEVLPREDAVRDRPSAAGVPGSGMLGMLVWMVSL
jgi:hypothetical protein